MTKTVRMPTKATGGVTPEELEKMKVHTDMWIKRIMRTEPADYEKLKVAIEGLYEVSGLKKPRVVLVPSPLVMAFAYGASVAILKNHSKNAHNATENATSNATDIATWNDTDNATDIATDNATWNATRNATDIATLNATSNATRNATWNATDNATDIATWNATDNATDNANPTDIATRNATDIATRNATDIATDIATSNATWNPTDIATRNATWNPTDIATRNATDIATDIATWNATLNAINNEISKDPVEQAKQICYILAGKEGLEYAKKWASVYQGGAYWGGHVCYFTAMRDIIGLKLPEFETYKYWEEAAIHGTFRVMHEDFCIISDFPEVLKVDDENRPHCQDGPSHRWRDEWELYHWHGVQVPKEWIMNPGHLTAKMAITWENIEQRRAACEILGWAKILKELKAKVIDTDGDPEIGELLEVELPDIGKEKFLRVLCGTGREFALPVPPDMKTALQAQSWTWGIDQKDFIKPEIRT